MSEIRYVCEGKCRTMVTVSEYKRGKKTCTVKTCDCFKRPLARKEYCSSCNTIFEEGEEHICMS
ncbi:MAG: hypothetical protein AB1668_04400 [Nanoarchaeota archaeon]